MSGRTERPPRDSVAATSGVLTGIFLLFVLPGIWHDEVESTIKVLAIVIGLLLVSWKFVGTRSLAIMLVAALGTAAFLLSVTEIASLLLRPMDRTEVRVGEVRQFLSECRPDEIRVVFLDGLPVRYSREKIWTVNLKTGLLSGGIVLEPTWFKKGLYENIVDTMNPLHTTHLEAIKTVLATLPPPQMESWFSNARFADDFHVAYYREGTLLVEHFAQEASFAQREKLFQLIEGHDIGTLPP